MKSFLEQSLIDLLPLLNTKNDPDEDTRLFKSAEILSNVEYELTASEIELARHFIACLVKNYISNRTITNIVRSASGGGQKTSLLEMGKKIEITKITSQDYRDAIGFGPSIRKLSLSLYLRPHLEYVLGLVWDKKYREFHRLTLIDKHYKKTKIKLKKIPLLIIAFPILLPYLFSKRARPFSIDNLIMSFRLLLFMETISIESWNNANRVFLNSGYERLSDLQNIVRIAGARLINDETASTLMQIGEMDYEQKYKLLGVRGQNSDATVDELAEKLKDTSDPEGMRITNALIIAAQRNPYAVHRYIDVMTDKEKYPKAIAEQMLIQDALVNVSKPALEAMLDEIANTPEFRSNNSRQGAANYSLLSHIVGLDPAAEEYLINTIAETKNFRKSVAALDAFRRLYKSLNVDSSSQMVNYCISLLRKPEYLKESIEEIEILDPIPRNLIIKIALKSLLAAPIDIQPVLFQRLINGVLDWDTKYIGDILIKMGAHPDEANLAMKAMLVDSLEDFENAIDRLIGNIKNINYKKALRIILSDPKSPPAFHFNETKGTNDPVLQTIFQFAENLTLLYQAQITAPGIICNEISDLERDVEWFSIHPNIKKFVSYFGKNYETFLPFWQNWPCSEKFFAAQSNLRNAEKLLLNENLDEKEQSKELSEELFAHLTSDDNMLSRNAQEVLLKSELDIKGAKYFLDLLEMEDSEMSASSDLSYQKSRIINTMHNAPIAINQDTIRYLLSRCHLPTSKEKIDFFSSIDDLGNVTDYWVNTFVASSVLASKFASMDDIKSLIIIAENQFLSAYAKTGILASFHKIRNPDWAVSYLPVLNEFAQSESSSVALAALYSVSKIIDNCKFIMNQSTVEFAIGIFENIFKVKNIKFQVRNKRAEDYSWVHHIDAHSINEFAAHELYQIYSS